MGMQTNFYMTESDEQEFMEFLRSDRDVAVLPYAFASIELVPLEKLPQPEVRDSLYLWLWDRTNSPRPTLRFVPEREYYVIDRTPSEVIEFSRSHVAAEGLVRGRIWTELRYWDLDSEPPKAMIKSETFSKWFERLSSWIKRKGTRNDDSEYVLPGAVRYQMEGGQLRQVLMAKNVKYFRH